MQQGDRNQLADLGGSKLATRLPLPGAKTYFEQALAIFEKTLGKEHPNTQVVSGNLQYLMEQIESEE